MARRVRLSKASVTRILDGAQTPSHRVLDLFRHVINDSQKLTEGTVPYQPGALSTEEAAAESRSLRAKLDLLRQKDPVAFNSIKAMIEALARSAESSSAGNADRLTEAKRRIVTEKVTKIRKP